MPKRLDTSYHKRMLAARMEDPEFRAEYERARGARSTRSTPSFASWTSFREQAGLTKADLARHIGRDPSSIRRLFTAKSNPSCS